MATKKKKFTLRAFEIQNPILTRQHSNLRELLSQRLDQTIVDQRRMPINSQDKDEDLICNYEENDNDFIWGSILRVCPSDNVLNIPDDLFQEDKIDLQVLDSLQDQGELMYRSHYYFLISNSRLITTLPRTTTITRLQTYINWFLEKLRGKEIYEFSPMIENAPILNLAAVRQLKVDMHDPIHNMDDTDTSSQSKSMLDVPLNFLREAMSDVSGLDETVLSQIISAKLLISLKRKPKDMDKDTYSKAMLSAYLKPMADLDHVTLYPRVGKPINGSEITKTEDIEVDQLASNNIAEKELKLKMESYLRSIS